MDPSLPEEDSPSPSLAGVEEVRELIQNYLVELGVVSKGDIKDLEAAVSPPII